MKVLGIESSCDETAAAILEKNGDQIKILSNVVASSLELQSKWGGVVPEQAAREQLKSIIPVLTEAFEQAKLTPTDIDTIAVTQGPGLIGSLLIGVETAKTLALIWQKPLIPVNHLIGHFYANWIQTQTSDFRPQISDQKQKKIFLANTAHPESVPSFPAIGLLVSGGHTDLVLFKDHSDYQYLGGTRDDAAGECFDKSARLLGLPYPGGPIISQLAESGDPTVYPLPKPMLDSGDFDFSFSGLKTALANLVTKLTANNSPLTPTQIQNICASLENTICEVLIKKTLRAAQQHQISQIIVAGGVAANQKLQHSLKLEMSKAPATAVENRKLEIDLYVPSPKLCTDNAAMIASAAFFLHPLDNPLTLQANPNLSLNN